MFFKNLQKKRKKERKGTQAGPCHREQGDLTTVGQCWTQVPSPAGGLRDPQPPCSRGVPLPCTLSPTTDPHPPAPSHKHACTHLPEPALGPASHQPPTHAHSVSFPASSAFQPVPPARTRSAARTPWPQLPCSPPRGAGHVSFQPTHPPFLFWVPVSLFSPRCPRGSQHSSQHRVALLVL